MVYNDVVVISMYEYKNQKELYDAIKPAMNVKLRLLKDSQYDNITCEDIWNYLRDSKWRSSVDLTLAEIVNDIIHADNKDIDIYLRKNKKDYEGGM